MYRVQGNAIMNTASELGPQCGALSLLQKPQQNRGLIVVLRPLFAAVLVVRRRYLIIVPRPLPAAPRMYLIVVFRPLPAAPLVVRCMCMAVVPRPMPAAIAPRCCRRRYQQLAFDAAVAGEEQLVSCAAEKGKYCSTLSIQ
jgi:hypothetical protein